MVEGQAAARRLLQLIKLGSLFFMGELILVLFVRLILL